MYTGYTEPTEAIERRKARILAGYKPENKKLIRNARALLDLLRTIERQQRRDRIHAAVISVGITWGIIAVVLAVVTW